MDRRPIQSSYFSFREMDGAVEADGIEISLIQLSKQERHNSRSRWFPSGPLRREGEKKGDIFHPPPLRSLCSPDILLTFGLKFNGTHIPHPFFRPSPRQQGNDRNGWGQEGGSPSGPIIMTKCGVRRGEGNCLLPHFLSNTHSAEKKEGRESE